MRHHICVLLMLLSTAAEAQNLTIETLLNDKISIRAIQLRKGKVWYTGTGSKFGYVNLKNAGDRQQLQISGNPELQFRTLADNRGFFYTVNIGSPAEFFEISKKDLKVQTVFKDTAKTAFYDALKFNRRGDAIGFSDPDPSLRLNIINKPKNSKSWVKVTDKLLPKLEKGEAAFAASNTNIDAEGRYVWIATGGTKARIYRKSRNQPSWEVFDTPFVQGSSSQGIYSIDFYSEKFGIAVGGDYTKQAENINNIAVTHDGGHTWQTVASGANAGYSTCVKFRPGTHGREILVVGDGHISLSKDFGKTWKKISDEKNLYTFEWIDRDRLVLAGKNRIITAKINE